MRMALAFEICPEIKDLVYGGIHDHGTGRGKPEIERLSPGSKKRAGDAAMSGSTGQT